MTDAAQSLLAEHADARLPQTAMQAFAAYESVRGRLPQARFAPAPRFLPSLAEVADHYDGFLLDAFGVLNLGDTAIPGAVARMAQLRAMGKRLVVLTNAASYTRPQLLAKYHRLGFDFAADEVVSSRDVAARYLDQIAPGGLWGALAAPGDSFADIPADLRDAIDDPGLFDRGRLLAARDLYEFDNVFTAPVHGFKNVDDYWARASAKPHLHRIAIPALVLNALNDPFIPVVSLPQPADVSRHVTLWQPAQGGHVGFPAAPFPGHVRAMPEAVAAFLGQQL